MDYNDPYNVQCNALTAFLRTTAVHGMLNAMPCRMLELGCGSGPFGRRLLAEYPQLHVTGVEVLPESVAALRQIVTRDGLERRYKPLLADIADAEVLESSGYDLILAPNVLHHIPRLAHTPVPDNLCRWLRPGGYLMVYDPNGANPVQQLSNQVTRVATRYIKALHPYKWPGETMYSPAYYRRVFTRHGFSYVYGFTHDPFLPVRDAGLFLLAVRNVLNNAVALVTRGDWRGAGQSLLFRKD